MKKLLWIVWLWMLVLPAFAQPDTLQKTVNRKVHWLVGVDAFSALNGLSLIGGVEVNRNKFSLSLSHLWHSSRFGVYYDYNVIRKYRFWVGMGLHTSFRFDKFDKNRTEYIKFLIEDNWKAERPDFAFLPNYGEVRNLYFLSVSLSKEFKIYKGLFLSLSAVGVGCYNPFYDTCGLSHLYGLQLYYKW